MKTYNIKTIKTQTLKSFIKETEEEFDENWKLDNPEETTSINENIKDFLSTKLQQAGEVAVEEYKNKKQRHLGQKYNCVYCGKKFVMEKASQRRCIACKYK